jgi:hypothetical protein
MVLSPCTSVFGLIGFSGRAGRERELVELLDGIAEHYGDDWWFNSQHSFALVETGQRDGAGPKIEGAMRRHPRNAHGAHIRAHLHYEDGEQPTAHSFLKAWVVDYSRDGQLHYHISGHLALCELEAGDAGEAFRIYADSISPDAICGPPLNALTDAVSSSGAPSSPVTCGTRRAGASCTISPAVCSPVLISPSPTCTPPWPTPLSAMAPLWRRDCGRCGTWRGRGVSPPALW